MCSVAGEGEGWREVEADGVYVMEVGSGQEPERYEWVVGEAEGDYVSAAGGLVGMRRGGLSCQTYFTGCRSPALAGSTRRFQQEVPLR